MKIMRRIGKLTSLLIALCALPAQHLWAWEHQDVGTTGAAGSFTENNGEFTITGAGLFGWVDQRFHIVHTSMHGNGTGNGSITVKLTQQQSAGSEAEAGLIMRKDLTNNSDQISFTRRPNGTLLFRRNKTNEG